MQQNEIVLSTAMVQMYQSQVEPSRAMLKCSGIRYNLVNPCQSVVESSRAKYIEPRYKCSRVRYRAKQSQCSKQSQVEPNRAMVYNVVESGKTKQSHVRVQQSQVEPSRTIVQCSRIQYSRVEPWQTVLVSSRAKQNHGTMWWSQADPVEPYYTAVESSNSAKQRHATLLQSLLTVPSRGMLQCSRVWQSQVEACYSVAESGRVKQSHATRLSKAESWYNVVVV